MTSHFMVAGTDADEYDLDDLERQLRALRGEFRTPTPNNFSVCEFEGRVALRVELQQRLRSQLNLGAKSLANALAKAFNARIMILITPDGKRESMNVVY